MIGYNMLAKPRVRLNPYRLLVEMRRFSPEVEASYQRYRGRVVSDIFWPATWPIALMFVAFHIWTVPQNTWIDPALLLIIRAGGAVFLLLMGWIASRVTDPRAVIHLASIGVLGGALSLIATHAMPGGPTIDGVVGLVLFMIATAILLMGVATATLLNGTVAAVALLAYHWRGLAPQQLLPLAIALGLALLTVVLASVFVEYLTRTNFRMVREQRAHAQIDQLTQLANRRAVDQLGEILVSESIAAGRPVSVLLLDIDHFKRINDTWGHECGDETLRTLAATLRGFFRATDLVARWGGEEFLVILPDTPLALAERLSTRLLRKVRDLNWVYRSNPVPVTVSIGITQASLRPHPELGPATLKSLINEADRALYYSKKNGRDQVAKFSDIADLQQSGFFERRGVSPLASQPPVAETI